jgi:hypothetical protein
METRHDIDYTVTIPGKLAGEQIGCQWCKHSNSCQYGVQIFDERWPYQHTIGHRTLREFIGLICKHFEK